MSDPIQLTPQGSIPSDVHCPQCAYDLQGSPGDRCPECGYALNNIRSSESRIPWVHRRKIGRFRAYWQTVWMVTFRNRRFCEEYARVVDYRDARLFQWVTILHVYLPILIGTIAIYFVFPPNLEIDNSMFPFSMPQGPTLLDRTYAEIWPVAIDHVCFVLFLAAATGVPSYFFHPRDVSIERQNSAIAMSYYACGPLAAVALVFALSLFAGTAAPDVWRAYAWSLDPFLGFLFLFWGGVCSLLWLNNLVRIAGRVMPQIKRRSVLIGLCVPLCWALLALLILVGLPFLILSVLVIFRTLS